MDKHVVLASVLAFASAAAVAGNGVETSQTSSAAGPAFHRGAPAATVDGSAAGDRRDAASNAWDEQALDATDPERTEVTDERERGTLAESRERTPLPAEDTAGIMAEQPEEDPEG